MDFSASIKSDELLKVEVRNSGIHGLGVFACCNIPEGTCIGHYQGPRTQDDGTYVLWIECEKDGVYGIDGQNLLKFTNHSHDPNATFDGPELQTLRQVQAGEEITFHYGEDWA